MNHYHGYDDCRYGCEWGNYHHHKPEDNMEDNMKIKIVVHLTRKKDGVDSARTDTVEMGAFNKYQPDDGWVITDFTTGSFS